MPIIGYKKDLTSHGSARWATPADLKRKDMLRDLKTLNGPILAKLGSPGSRAAFLSPVNIPHCLVSAPSGSGKTVGVTIPTCLTYPGSILATDINGELFEATSRRREALGDAVYRFAPYDEGGRTHRYNPLQIVVFRFIEGFYNPSRRHSSIGYVSPIQFEAAHQSDRALAVTPKPETCP